MRSSAELSCAIALTAALLGFVLAPEASALPVLKSSVSTPGAVAKIHDRRDGASEDAGLHRGRHHRHRPHRIVEAPFTHVESGQHVIVDAPFTHVAVGRRGRHIVAPFVNIWVPR